MTIYEVEFHYGRNTYEFMSELPLEIGGTYKITNELGHTYKSRARIVDIRDVSVFSGSLHEIVDAVEAPAWD